MISLITDFRKTSDGLNMLQSQLHALIGGLPPAPSREELLETIQAIQFLNTQSFSADLQNLAAEERHFKSAYKKNQRTAAYARRKSLTGQSRFVNTPEHQLEAATTASYTPRTPTSLRLSKPLSSAIADARKAEEMKDYREDLLSPLTLRKLELDALRAKYNMPALYDDPADDSQPLHPDDCPTGSPNAESADDGLF